MRKIDNRREILWKAPEYIKIPKIMIIDNRWVQFDTGHPVIIDLWKSVKN